LFSLDVVYYVELFTVFVPKVTPFSLSLVMCFIVSTIIRTCLVCNLANSVLTCLKTMESERMMLFAESLEIFLSYEWICFATSRGSKYCNQHVLYFCVYLL